MPTASSGSAITIRLPLPLLALATAFLMFWCGEVMWMTMIRHHGGSVIVGVLFLAAGAALASAAWFTRVEAGTDGRLVVRNKWSRRAFDRREIRDFLLTSGLQFGWLTASTILVQLRDGTAFPLAATQGAPWRRRSRQERDLARLRAWLTEA